SAEALYVKAGILEQKPASAVTDAVLADPALTERQKQVLLDIYQSFRRENDSSPPTKECSSWQWTFRPPPTPARRAATPPTPPPSAPRPRARRCPRSSAPRTAASAPSPRPSRACSTGSPSCRST